MPQDLLFTQRSLQLAAYGLGQISKQPLSAWVITHEQQVIQEGWVSSTDLMQTLTSRLSEQYPENSRIYFNIDPALCLSHPEECEILLNRLSRCHIDILLAPHISAKTRQIANKFHIHTKNISDLQQASQKLNKRFFTWKDTKRPYIVLKWAQTADGFIARSNYDSKWISNVHSRKLVHQWRTQEDAIMVGTNTCHYDNPRLNVRDWAGRNPIRIVIDRQLRLDEQLHIFDGSQPTICYNGSKNERKFNLEYVQLHSPSFTPFMQEVLQDMYQRGIYSIFVEGGAQLLNFLLSKGWWDEARVFQSAISFGEGISAPVLPALPQDEWVVSGDRLLLYQKLNKK